MEREDGAMSEATQPAPEVWTLLYVGVIDGDDGKLWHKYLPVSDWEQTEHNYVDGKIGEQPSYFGKKISHGQPGHVFTIHKTPNKEGSVQVNTAKFIGLWNDPKKRAAWQAESTAREHAHEQHREVEKLLKGRADKLALDPFRAAYWKLDARGRRQLLAEVIRYITGGKE
jgi:hypothetical protein